MRSQMRARVRATQRRQRLQIGGGALVVAAIWTIALWPSADGGPGPQATSAPRAAYTPWTTGPFVGSQGPASESSIPTVLASTIPTVQGGATPGRAGRGGGRTPATAPTSAAAATSATTTTVTTTVPPTSPSSQPGRKGSKPPKPTQEPSPSTTTTDDGFDLFDLFGL